MPTYARDVDPNEPLHPGTIYINQALSSIWTEEQIAPIIAHEALHADCNYDPTKWANIMLGQLNAGKIPPPPLLVSGNLDWTDPINGVKYLNDTVQQEYNTFKEEIFVWQEVRGSQTSREYDTLLADYNNDQANGTTTFYDEIASRYPNPPYKAY